MKKIIFVLFVALVTTMISCEGKTKTEDVAVGASAVTEALEKLSETESDTTSFCDCPHKCKTKEECAKNCEDMCEKK